MDDLEEFLEARLDAEVMRRLGEGQSEYQSEYKNPLTAPTKSLSLWTKSGEEKVGTYRDAAPVDAQGDDAIREARSIPKNVCSIQIVKRDRSYVVFVDGVKTSEVKYTEEIPAVVTVPVDSNVKMHYEKRMDISVMTPLAITLMTEDGEMAPSNCDVQIKQEVTTRGQELRATREDLYPTVSLNSFSPSDLTANVVFAPFPLTFPVVPTVALLDKTKVYIYDQKGLKSMLDNGGALLRTGIATLPSMISRSLGLSSAEATEALTFQTASFAISDYFLGTNSSEARRSAENMTDIGPALIVAAAMAGLLISTGPAFMAGAATLSTAASAAFNAASWAGAMSALFSGLQTFTSLPAKPTADVLRFSIPEFTNVLRTLASISAMNDETIKQVADRGKLQTELVVWRFLTEGLSSRWYARSSPLVNDKEEDEEATTVPSSSLMNNELAVNAIDNIASPNLARSTSIKMSVRVSITDNELCNQNKEIVLDFKNNSMDAPVLGNIASGVVKELEELSQAVDELRLAVDNSIDNEISQETWWDANYFWYLTGTIRQMFGSAENLKPQKAVKLLRRSMLGAVQRNLHEKLVRPLSLKNQPSSASSKAIARMDGALSSRDYPSSDVVGEYWRRMLPQRLSSAKFAYDSVQLTNAGINDQVVDNVPVRIFKPLHDASMRQRQVLEQSKHAISRLRDEWEQEGSIRPSLVQIAESIDELHSTPSNVNIHSFVAAATQKPRSIAQQSLEGLLTETESKATDLICHSMFSDGVKALGISDSEHGTSAARFFGVVFCEEIASTFDIRQKPRQIEHAMRSAVDRASGRLLESAEVLAEVAKNGRSIGAPKAEDPFFKATARGRDALLAMSLLNIAITENSTGSMTKRTVDSLSKLRNSVVSVAKTMSAKPERAFHIPIEPLQSLFMSAKDNVCGFRRMRAFFPTSTVASEVFMRAQAASYTALQFLSVDEENAIKDKSFEFPESRRVPLNWGQINSFMAHRAASLSIDTPRADDIATVEYESELVELFSPMSLDGKPPSLYFVPFGYGNFPTSLGASASPAVMFGSVPVFTDHLVKSINSLVVLTDNAVDTGSASVMPLFVQQCVFELPAKLAGLKSKPPDFIQRNEDGFTFFGSLAPMIGPGMRAGAEKETTGSQAASKFLNFTDDASFTETIVSFTSWTTERLLQCMCLAAANNKGIVLDLKTPFEFANTVSGETDNSSATDLALLSIEVRMAADRHKRSLWQIYLAARLYLEHLGRTLPPDPPGPPPPPTMPTGLGSGLFVDEFDTSYTLEGLGSTPNTTESRTEVAGFLKATKRTEEPQLSQRLKDGLEGVNTLQKALKWEEISENATQNVIDFLLQDALYSNAAPILQDEFTPVIDANDDTGKTKEQLADEYASEAVRKRPDVDPFPVKRAKYDQQELSRLKDLYESKLKDSTRKPVNRKADVDVKRQTIKMHVGALCLAGAMAYESLGAMPDVKLVIGEDELDMVNELNDMLKLRFSETSLPPALRFVEAAAVISLYCNDV